MKKQIKIADSELPIMKVLWEKGELSSPMIFECLDGNISTLKTLLKRLVDKGAVKTKKLDARSYIYSPVISESEYIRYERKGFLDRIFDGSREKMLLNFVKDEKITKEELQRLIDLIDEEE